MPSASCPRLGQAERVRLLEVADEQRADRHLGADVDEDRRPRRAPGGGTARRCRDRATRSRRRRRPTRWYRSWAASSARQSPPAGRARPPGRRTGAEPPAPPAPAGPPGVSLASSAADRPGDRQDERADEHGNARSPSELNACVSVSRDEAVSGLPSMATNGLAATCRITMPVASTKKRPGTRRTNGRRPPGRTAGSRAPRPPGPP